MAFCEPRPRRSVAAAGKELLSTGESHQTFCRLRRAPCRSRRPEEKLLSTDESRQTFCRLVAGV
jgi:hypothetical protein